MIPINFLYFFIFKEVLGMINDVYFEQKMIKKKKTIDTLLHLESKKKRNIIFNIFSLLGSDNSYRFIEFL